jgi:hypothetical protein
VLTAKRNADKSFELSQEKSNIKNQTAKLQIKIQNESRIEWKVA